AYLATAPCLRELKSLELDRCEIQSSAARHLAGALFLGSLRHLNLNHNNFDSNGLRALLENKPSALHTLQMFHNNLEDEAASHLAGSSASDTLLELDLAGNFLGDRAAQALASSKHLQNLLILRLDHNPISERAAAALAQSPLGKRLAVLEVTGPEEIPF